MSQAPSTPPPVNLCVSCRHLRVIISKKGSRFLYCLRSETDKQYPKYPRLPVLQCQGYEQRRVSSPRS